MATCRPGVLRLLRELRRALSRFRFSASFCTASLPSLACQTCQQWPIMGVQLARETANKEMLRAFNNEVTEMA